MNNEPLASKIRPKALKEFVGQKHLVGTNKPIKTAIQKNHLFSIIFWGPPGVGKTTLAKIYADSLHAHFVELSAVSAGKDDVRKVISMADKSDIPVIMFLDEIHRFNKVQQDFLLPYVEKGVITLIGATTENPSFEVISPLLSRCQVFILEELSAKDMEKIINRAVSAVYSKKTPQKLDKEAVEWLTNMANGDARKAISLIENTHKMFGKVDLALMKEALQSKYLRYDKKGEEHYNTISAFIKSMRASDVDAGLYYLARMVESGEDPLFIARRMVIFASEDIGIAKNEALLMANAVFRACETIGYPECAINLAHGVVYLCKCPKSRRSYDGLRKAQKDVLKHGNLKIPLKIRNAVTDFMKDIGYEKDYDMYDDESLLPDEIKGKKYF